MLTIDRTIQISAPVDAVFRCYADVQSWPDWDSEVTVVDLPQGLVPGATGWLKPRQGPKARLVVTEVEQDRSFTIQSRLPLCEMRFGHDLVGDGGVTTVRHWVSFVGPLAPLFRHLIGRSIAATLPATLAGLKAACEAP
ncbi:MAG: SRPBCC family protein [Sandaracinobacter sp.]